MREPLIPLVPASLGALIGLTTALAAQCNPHWLQGDGVPGVAGKVYAMTTLPNGDLVAGGVNCSRIARWDGSSWSAMGQGTDGGVFTMATLPTGGLAAGGNLYTAGGLAAGNFAQLETPCPAAATPVATSCTGPAGPVTLTATSLPWCGATFASTATGFAPNALTVGHALPIPDVVALAGLQLHHQFLQAGLSPTNQLTSLSASNALHATIGAF